ncbi:hypothetical protein PtrM4_114420 [Pyrenophora tritici-repentis]|uniref:Uncharacterized protein n=1 Tax=Pyrenophora tritici-repentis TaxID=45151 RepID=A0A834RW39_9PLEO|nr:hypothetical protein A1F99_082020 [Pyrenophora tritici-repentis]KAF7569027.1 hypothetical protein PtrM4_114420 [Pyrenophora tritici-repentis]
MRLGKATIAGSAPGRTLKWQQHEAMPHWWQFDPTTPTRGQDTPAISDDRGGQDGEGGIDWDWGTEGDCACTTSP